MTAAQIKHRLMSLCTNYIAKKEKDLEARAQYTVEETDPVLTESLRGRVLTNTGFDRWIGLMLYKSVTNLNEINPNPLRTSEVRYNQASAAERATYVNRRDLFLNSTSNVSWEAQTNPKLLLENLESLIKEIENVITTVEEKNNFGIAKQTRDNYCKSHPQSSINKNDPFSLQIQTALQKINAQIDYILFMAKAGDDKSKIFRFEGKHTRDRLIPRCIELQDTITTITTSLNDYLKKILVEDIKNILEQQDDRTAANALTAVYELVSKEETAEILKKNSQSDWEFYFKIFACATIVPGVVLAAKRLYDSGGTSINFFKPLSENLLDEAQKLTLNC